MPDVFWTNIFRRGDSELRTITELWQETPLFREIPARETARLCETMHLRRFEADETVFSQGDQGAGAILVLDGSVRISADRTELARLERGDFFGEIALAAPERRTADAVTVGASRLVFFLKQDLEEWLEYEPRLGARFLMNLSASLAQRLFEANRIIAEHQ